MIGYGLAMTMYHRILFETLMKSYISILNYENKNYNYYLDSDHCGRINWTFIMNILYKISYGLFALAFISGLLIYLTATFLLFTAGVSMLVLAVYVNEER
jgi:hypothetical protein